MICNKCNNEMLKSKKDINLNYGNKILTVYDVDIYACGRCGNEVITDKEFEKIEDILKIE